MHLIKPACARYLRKSGSGQRVRGTGAANTTSSAAATTSSRSSAGSTTSPSVAPGAGSGSTIPAVRGATRPNATRTVAVETSVRAAISRSVKARGRQCHDPRGQGPGELAGTPWARPFPHQSDNTAIAKRPGPPPQRGRTDTERGSDLSR